MKAPLLTACLRSYGRPLRTRRMLESIAQQNFSHAELLFMGDGCPVFDDLVKSDFFTQFKKDMRQRGNAVFYFNAYHSHKDWGAHVTNQAIKLATGKHFLFLDNDDKLLPEHFDFYYRSIAMHERDKTPVDFVYNKTFINNGGFPWVMDPELKQGSVGHASLIVRTEFLKQMPPHQPTYGQDWTLIEHMMTAGKGFKGNILFPTYYVMSLPGKPEPGMENDN